MDKEMERLVMKYGVPDVLAALCRHVNKRGMIVLFSQIK